MTAPHCRVKDIADQIRGVTYGKQDASSIRIDGYLPVLRAGNITDEGLIFDELVYVPASKIRPKQMIQKGDIVIAASSGSIGVVGKAAPALENFQGGFGAFCKVIRPRKEVHSKYLSHYFKTQAYRRIVSSLAAGVNINNLRNEDLDNLQIPLPPLAEQKRIAAMLDAADALRARRRESLAQLDALLQSTFLEMFGDPVTNPMGWEMEPFDRMGKFVSGATPSKANGEYWGGSVPWVSPKDMKTSRISDSQDHISERAVHNTNIKVLSPGHLLIVVRGMILAHSFPVATNLVPVTINQDMKGISPSLEFDVNYLLECATRLKRRILPEVSFAGHGTRRLDATAMSKILVPKPPVDLQRRFAAIVESVEEQKARMRVHLAELDALFASLQSRAFNGEL